MTSMRLERFTAISFALVRRRGRRRIRFQVDGLFATERAQSGQVFCRQDRARRERRRDGQADEETEADARLGWDGRHERRLREDDVRNALTVEGLDDPRLLLF